MKYVIKMVEQGHPFYIKNVDHKGGTISIENEPEEALFFDTEEEALSCIAKLGRPARNKCSVHTVTSVKDRHPETLELLDVE